MRVGAHSCGADRFRGRNNLATQPMPTLLAMGPGFELHCGRPLSRDVWFCFRLEVPVTNRAAP